ncbi:hypothetical protein ACHAQA_008805 [Verticillium albo-atrum]
MSKFPVTLSNPALLDSRGFVKGQWKLPESQKTFPVSNPATGATLYECANFSREDFVEAITFAQDGFLKFSQNTTATERGQILRRWYDLVLQNAEDIAKILSLENGKPLYEARGEVKYAASFIAWFAEEATRAYGDQIPSSYPNATVITFKEAVGVCSIITPWNFPAAMITRKIAPAFAAGCAVVIKPPSETPFTAIALTKLALEAGIPSDVIQLVPTADRKATLELVTHPLVKKISFTGSTGVGKMFTQLAAGTMKKVSMELGGNAPFIVFDDADLDLAVEGAVISKFRSSGQTCVCANRILVHQSIAEDFTSKLVEKVRSMKLGSGLDADTTHGPLVNSNAVAKVIEHVEDAVANGGQVLIGGKTPEHLTGFFFEPTVIRGATLKMKIAYEETFGPVAAIFEFSTEEEAVTLANDTEFGLAGYFFSRDVGRVLRVARKLDCGMVGVNTGLISAAEAPFGGVKESGVGREGSKYGLSEYQNIKTVTIGNNHM